MNSDRESDDLADPATYSDLVSDSEEEEERAMGIAPYMFEPAPEPLLAGAVGDAAARHDPGEGGREDERLGNNEW